jgi:hypothetical protein
LVKRGKPALRPSGFAGGDGGMPDDACKFFIPKLAPM